MNKFGYINQSQRMVTGIVDYISKALPFGTSGALCAGISILAAPAVVDGSILLGEAAHFGIVGYCIGKKETNLVTDTARKLIHVQLNSNIE